ncbi:unnamed protein product, partial [marine sediment metagenome]
LSDMTLGSVFSGGGLGDFGWFAAGFEIKWQIEIDDYCQKILELRFPKTKKYRNAKEEHNLEAVDIIAGGPPCQPFSTAGQQRGEEDNRNLWPTMLKIVKKVRPSFVVVENVSGIINIYLDIILSDLEGEGYSCRTFVFPAHALGAAHRRERIWIVAFSSNTRTQGMRQRKEQAIEDMAKSSSGGLEGSFSGDNEGCRKAQSKRGSQTDRLKRRNKIMANTVSRRSQNRRAKSDKKIIHKRNEDLRPAVAEFCRSWWSTEPAVGRVVNGCSRRVDRLKVLGNGQVPACTYI